MSKIDIVNRLKDSLVWLERDGFITSAKNAIDAVSEINELRAENSRLSADVERLKQELDEALLIHQTDTGTESVVATLQARIDGLEAERTWQPIETAECGKNGIAFMNVAWGSAEDPSCGMAIRVDNKFFAAAVFFCAGSKEKPVEIREVQVSPFAWMPLPQSPDVKP